MLYNAQTKIIKPYSTLHSMDTLYDFVKFMSVGPDIRVDECYITSNVDDREGPPPPKLDILQDRGPER